jgi:hypothetical protein
MFIMVAKVLNMKEDVFGKSKVIWTGSNKRKQRNANTFVLLHLWSGPTQNPEHPPRCNQLHQLKVQLEYKKNYEACCWGQALVFEEVLLQ